MGVPAISDRLKRAVEAKEIPGAIALVLERNEVVHFEIAGLRDRERGLAMERDTIVRLASTTKPVTAAAAMVLVDDGAIGLDDPVDRWLPEIANRRVLRDMTGPLDDVYPSPRPITLRDLLTYRCGYTLWAFLPPCPLVAALSAAFPMTPSLNGEMTPDEFMRRLGDFPLCYPPGEVWQYHIPSDILGVLIARISRQPFEAFLEERLFRPLKMADTGFFVPPAKRDRLAAAYSAAGGELLLVDDPARSAWAEPPKFPSGGGGLVSTLDDCLAFARMMLAGGTFGGKRLLSERSVKLMTTIHAPAEKMSPIFVETFGAGVGFGLGVSVAGTTSPQSGPAGVYGWPGLYGTNWSNSPATGTIALILTQAMIPGFVTPVALDFMKAAYAAHV